MKTGEFSRKIVIESYGVVCVVRTNSPRAARQIRSVAATYLPGCEFIASDAGAEHEFLYRWNPSGRDSLYKDGGLLHKRVERRSLLEILGSLVRIAVAEYAVGRVFVHAGVVGWKGKAIIIPARSFKGKTALTAELVKLGARYYSDEYAVLDQRGRVHPFPKDLSIRGIINDHQQLDHSVEELGGKAGKRPIPAGLVLITEYKAGAKWRPKLLNAGLGMMALIDNTVPIRRDPHFALPILSKVATEAMIVKTKRGEAAEAAALILKLFEAE